MEFQRYLWNGLYPFILTAPTKMIRTFNDTKLHRNQSPERSIPVTYKAVIDEWMASGNFDNDLKAMCDGLSEEHIIANSGFGEHWPIACPYLLSLLLSTYV